MVNRRFATTLELIAVAAKAQRRQTPLAFNDLPVDIVDVRAIALLTKERLPRIRGDVIGNVEYAAVHRRNQHVNFLRGRPLFHAGFHFHRQHLVRTHFGRIFQGDAQATVLIAHRQMQQAYSPFWRGRFGFIARANHQRGEVKIVAFPGFIYRDRHIQPFSRDVDLFPPQRPFAGFNHRIAFTCRRGGNVQLDGIPWLIGRFVQLQGDAIRSRCAGAVAVVLPAVARPEAHAAHCIIRGFNLQTVGAPLHREAHFPRFVRGQIQRLLAFDQIFLIKLRLPAVTFRPGPGVVPTFADQANLQTRNGFLRPAGISINNVEPGLAVLLHNRLVDGGIGAVVIDRFAGELRTDARQGGRRPDGLFRPAGHRTSAGL